MFEELLGTYQDRMPAADFETLKNTVATYNGWYGQQDPRMQNYGNQQASNYFTGLDAQYPAAPTTASPTNVATPTGQASDIQPPPSSYATPQYVAPESVVTPPAPEVSPVVEPQVEIPASPPAQVPEVLPPPVETAPPISTPMQNPNPAAQVIAPAQEPAATYQNAVTPSVTPTPVTNPIEDATPNFDSLTEKLAQMPYDKQYVDLMSGNMRQNLMNTADASRREMADRLASQGIEGGLALDQLSGVDRSAAQGTASGLSSIMSHAMDNAYTDRRAALQGNLAKMNTAVNLESLKNQFGLKSYEDQMNFALQLMQMAQYADITQQENLMKMANTLLNGDPSAVLGSA
jgi:hypothetical protein